MTRAIPTRAIADRRSWIYATGIAAIVGIQLASVPRSMQGPLVSVVLGLMVLTFVVERGQEAEGGITSPAAFAVGGIGIVAGVWLTTTGRLAGLAFLAGGLLFLSWSLQTGDRE